jgi:hypothetical protein
MPTNWLKRARRARNPDWVVEQPLEAIAAVEGVDALFIGPSDLAADMGHLGNKRRRHSGASDRGAPSNRPLNRAFGRVHFFSVPLRLCGNLCGVIAA